MSLSDFDKGRIEGALVYWDYYVHNGQVSVPGVDKMLGLPVGTTSLYLSEKRNSE